MKQKCLNLPHHLANAVALLVVIAILSAAYLMQFIDGDLPCPLCLLQRACFIAVGVGVSMNVRFGPRPVYYGLSLLAAIIGFFIAVRQVLLHIKPGDPGYGSPFMGIHLYTWSVIAFLAFIIGFSIALLFAFHAEEGRKVHPSPLIGAKLLNILIIIFTLLILANVISTFIECGPYQCPDNPVSYWLFNR